MRTEFLIAILGIVCGLFGGNLLVNVIFPTVSGSVYSIQQQAVNKKLILVVRDSSFVIDFESIVELPEQSRKKLLTLMQASSVLPDSFSYTFDGFNAAISHDEYMEILAECLWPKE